MLTLLVSHNDASRKEIGIVLLGQTQPCALPLLTVSVLCRRLGYNDISVTARRCTRHGAAPDDTGWAGARRRPVPANGWETTWPVERRGRRASSIDNRRNYRRLLTTPIESVWKPQP